MRLFIHECIIEPLRALGAVVEIAFAALVFCLFVLFLIYCARKAARRLTKPVEAARDSLDVCYFVGGPIGGRYLPVPPAATDYFSVDRVPDPRGFCPGSALARSHFRRVKYNRTGPNEFTVECEDHDWKLRDDSFDHEYGTEVVHTMVCQNCGAEREETRDDHPDLDDDVA